MAARPSVLVAMLVLTLVDARDVENVWSVWNLTVKEPKVQFELSVPEEEVCILATGKASIKMINGGVNMGVLCSDAHGQPTLEVAVENCTDPTLKLFHPLKLDIKLNNGNYEILANGEKLKRGYRFAYPGNFNLTLDAQLMENTTGSVFVAYHLPPVLPQPPKAQGPSQAWSRVILMTALLVVFATLFLVAVVIIVFLLRLLPPASRPVWAPRRLAAAQLQKTDLKQLDTVAQGAGKDLDDTEPLPLPPRRPSNTIATTSAGPPVTSKGNYVFKNDPEYDYIMVNDVKPVEVEILKQQNIISGEVYHTA